MVRQVIVSESLARLGAPASHGIAAGGLAFTGGMVGLDAAGGLVGGTPGRPDVEAQIEEALRNTAIVLDELGSDLGRLAKVKASLSDWSVYARCRRRYGQLLGFLSILLAELRRRVGQAYTLEDLAAAYADSERWASEVMQERAEAPGWARDLTTVLAAAFDAYQRGAIDYEP